MVCELCECAEAHNFHHLIPRTLHRNKWFKKRYSREQMAAGLQLCKMCHKTIHEFVREKELGRKFNSKQKLLAQPRIAKFIEWKRKHA